MQIVGHEDEREFQRTRIAVADLNEAIDFIEAAGRLAGIDPKTDVTHRALVSAAVIYYARPFLNNEAHGAPRSLVELSDTELRAILPDPARRALHDEIINNRKKIVAHAEGDFFKVEVIPPAWFTDPQLSVIDLNFVAQRTYPSPDLVLMRQNAVDLRTFLTFRTIEVLERIKGKTCLPTSSAG